MKILPIAAILLLLLGATAAPLMPDHKIPGSAVAGQSGQHRELSCAQKEGQAWRNWHDAQRECAYFSVASWSNDDCYFRNYEPNACCPGDDMSWACSHFWPK